MQSWKTWVVVAVFVLLSISYAIDTMIESIFGIKIDSIFLWFFDADFLGLE
jgi:hypothetical protein